MPPPRAELSAELGARAPPTAARPPPPEPPTLAHPRTPPPPPAPGDRYYVNSVTKASEWEKPASLAWAKFPYLGEPKDEDKDKEEEAAAAAEEDNTVKLEL